MTDKELETKALEIATSCHRGQTRRDGKTSYIEHPISVADKLRKNGESSEVIAVGYLHDCGEDCGLTSEELRQEGFPEDVIEAFEAMTHKDGDSYVDYLKIVNQNEIAMKVKKQDILHNMSDGPTERQIVKYSLALLFLYGDSDINKDVLERRLSKY